MLAILQNVSSLLTYNRQTLLGIKCITEELLRDAKCGAQFASPLANIPDYLRRLPGPLPERKRRKRQGRRGGFAVKFKLLLSESDFSTSCWPSHLHGRAWPLHCGARARTTVCVEYTDCWGSVGSTSKESLTVSAPRWRLY